ncbi:MATE family efflux transporter [Burkholderia sp. Ac-20344]|uniref:MATE family efflux transporter n=1 Tax=Burkholderia sp. Ac-20344 TaxID=2703890 RepID=UPI00197C90DB|nr:MATE family efflux transporter [Burkholderia sp. Ac-20344]MBN3831911.1 MATE family efflux transporter [Burkholderia sp. Ac-20344]
MNLETLRSELQVVVRLAATMAATRLLTYLSGVISMAIVGHFSTVAMASLTLAIAVQQVMIVACFSGLVGTETEVAKRYGAGEHREATAFAVSSILVGLSLGILMAGMSLGFYSMLASHPSGSGIDASSPLLTIGCGIPALCVYLSISFYFEAIQRPRIVLFLAALGTFVNAIATYGLVRIATSISVSPEFSAALALTLSRFLQASVALALVIWLNRTEVRSAVLRSRDRFLKDFAALVKIGVPAGTADALTTIAVSSMTLLVGRLGVVALNAYQIASQWLGLLMLIGAGCATAATIRATQAVGNQDHIRAVSATIAGIVVLIALDVIVAIAYLTAPGLWSQMYGVSQHAARYAIWNQAWATLIFVIECPLVLLIGVGRAHGITVKLPAIKAACFIVIALPICFWIVTRLTNPLPFLLAGIAPAVAVALSVIAWKMRGALGIGNVEARAGVSRL